MLTPQQGPRRQRHVVLIDLGLAVSLQQEQEQEGGMGGSSRLRGKPSYVSPEVVQGRCNDALAADMWSLGVCLFTLLTGCPLYASPEDAAFSVLLQPQGLDVLVEHYSRLGLTRPSPEAMAVLRDMLAPHPAHRPSLQDLLRRPFFHLPDKQQAAAVAAEASVAAAAAGSSSSPLSISGF